MLDYLEYLQIPAGVSIGLAGFLFALQIAGKVLEVKGKAVPEIMNVRKYFDRKKQERYALSQMPEILKEHKQTKEENAEMSKTILEVHRLLSDIDKHYSSDNIAMRDNWMMQVNNHMAEGEKLRIKQEEIMNALSEKLDKNNADTLAILIDNKRNTIINFASYVSDKRNAVTREQFKRIFKIHSEYEEIIQENDMTNGEVDVAYRIIVESYEDHIKERTFIEDIKGYDVR